MPLHAPLEVPAEIRAVVTREAAPGSHAHAADADGPRCFRRTVGIDADGITLARPAPFPRGERVRVTLALPAADPATPLAPFAVAGSIAESDEDPPRTTRIELAQPDDDTRTRIAAYLQERLGIPA